MFKTWLKQFFAVCLCIMIVISPIQHVKASDYIINDSSDDEDYGDAQYFIIEGKDVDDLFDFGLYDIPDILSWVFNFKTYTVIKRYQDIDDKDKTVYKMYYNTPNLQMYLRNMISSLVDDGYTDETYKVEDTEWVVKVGKNADKENVITKYGFSIPNYIYNGEYPKEVMSTAGIIPETHWYEVLWNAITSLFGASFLDAPDADNFNTITYLNHTYTDDSEFILNFIKENYLTYFERKIPVGSVDGEPYFNSPEHMMELCTTEQECWDAIQYITDNSDIIEKVIKKEVVWRIYEAAIANEVANPAHATATITASAPGKDAYIIHNDVTDVDVDVYHYIASFENYYQGIKAWLDGSVNPNDTYVAYTLLDMLTDRDEDDGVYPRYQYGVSQGLFDSSYDTPADYGFAGPYDFRRWSDYVSEFDFSYLWLQRLGYNQEASVMADIERYSNNFAKVNINYDVKSATYYHYYDSRGDIEPNWDNATLALADVEDNVSYESTAPYRDNTSSYYYDCTSSDSFYHPVKYDIIEKQPKQSTSDDDKDDTTTETNASPGTTYATPGKSDNSIVNLDEYDWAKDTNNNGTNLDDDDNVDNTNDNSDSDTDSDDDDDDEEDEEEEEETEDVVVGYAYIMFRKCNYRINWVWDLDDDGKGKENHKIAFADYRRYRDNLTFDTFKNGIYDPTRVEGATQGLFIRDDFIPVNEQIIFDTGVAAKETIEHYKAFVEMINRGPDGKKDKKPYILYRQCMITNEGDDEECWSQKYGGDKDEKTTLSIMQVYAYSGLYKITEKYKNSTETELTTEEAYQIINTIRSYCGPYYTEVIANMIKLMCATSKWQNGENDKLSRTISNADPRIMPYDTSSLVTSDKANYQVEDPRVQMFKSHILGHFVSELEIGGNLFYFFTPQEKIIHIAGVITEISVFMQQLCNFSILDDYGLSPADMWTSGYAAMLMAFLVLFFIFKTVKATIQCAKGSTKVGQVIAAFIVLLIELAFIGLMLVDSKGTWNKIKEVENKIINLGEAGTTQNWGDIQYMFGDEPDYSVVYYMPYLDTWAKYNTGYGILASQQEVDDILDKPELEKSYRHDPEKSTWPYIGETFSDDTLVKHWAIVLADSFSYYGTTRSIQYSVMEDGQVYNGPRINNNAYRVVDHFMAPRFKINDSGEKISFTVTQNENYNGEYQSGFIDLIVKLMNCVLCCLLSLIKFMTFIWQWFMFYIFIFKVILDKAQKRTGKEILVTTVGPTLALICIGLYNGVAMTLGMKASGVLGIFLLAFLFYITFLVIHVWREKFQPFYPKTLGWLYILTSNRNRYSNKKQSKELDAAAKRWGGDSFFVQTNKFFGLDPNSEDSDPNNTTLSDNQGKTLLIEEWRHCEASDENINIFKIWLDQYNTLKQMPEYSDLLKLNYWNTRFDRIKERFDQMTGVEEEQDSQNEEETPDVSPDEFDENIDDDINNNEDENSEDSSDDSSNDSSSDSSDTDDDT